MQHDRTFRKLDPCANVDAGLRLFAELRSEICSAWIVVVKQKVLDDRVGFDDGDGSIGEDGRTTEGVDLFEIGAGEPCDGIAFVVFDRVRYAKLFEQEEDSVGSTQFEMVQHQTGCTASG
ncbi:hypothetical protein PHSY_002662 [Pseudozyma hubeiensis SY62]|uniref:Uncharacterized protein n=1 Tax=Pseudozyma hubeiensis (strain SY62) TaxID=1305764 RepID=R9P1Q6_PSEHS|nr:hypothetical protein PHSY_002662 [Pseudozyma hubeiensis SY62]GAC95087.1 hypothetical protein PHSY_002662 [Pseudozyma hubeiensis SY62]